MSGLTLQMLAKGVLALPLIFITGHGDIPMSVRAMKAGAVAAIIEARQRFQTTMYW